ncbi:MAG: tol-pal system protein YbgF [Alphaproteobacteria bacterium]|nr:tol-pal system protein YbgF [Alphaproteobacteria bacterium]
MMPRPWIGAVLATALLASPAAAQAPQVYAQQELRLTQLEDQIRQLTGRVEELTFQIQQVRQALERSQRDTDFRLTELERGGRPGAAAAGSPPDAPRPDMPRPDMPRPEAPRPPTATMPPPGPPPMAAAPPPPRDGAGTPPPGQSRVVAPPGPGTTTMRPGPGPGPSAPPPQAAAPRAPQPEGTLPAGAPQQQYDQAFALLARADYDGAERALKAFLRQYPNDGLAGNAQYWLGETYYVRQDYQNAAIAFGEGFQRYPRSSKAPDNLLKLGMSLAQINKKPEACGALGRLDQMADAPANVKDRARRERQRLGC